MLIDSWFLEIFDWFSVFFFKQEKKTNIKTVYWTKQSGILWIHHKHKQIYFLHTSNGLQLTHMECGDDLQTDPPPPEPLTQPRAHSAIRGGAKCACSECAHTLYMPEHRLSIKCIVSASALTRSVHFTTHTHTHRVSDVRLRWTLARAKRYQWTQKEHSPRFRTVRCIYFSSSCG